MLVEENILPNGLRGLAETGYVILEVAILMPPVLSGMSAGGNLRDIYSSAEKDRLAAAHNAQTLRFLLGNWKTWQLAEMTVQPSAVCKIFVFVIHA